MTQTILNKLGIVTVLLCCVALGACAGKTVSVVQPRHFKVMADRMPEELIARDILDKNRDYVAPLMDSDADIAFGRELYRRLKPDFLLGDLTGTPQVGSFADLVPNGKLVQMRYAGFFINAKQHIAVNMIAVLDWDDDGQKDWLFSCAIEPLPGGRRREYYVVIPSPPEKGPLEGTVVAVYDATGIFGKMYLRDKKSEDKPAPQANPAGSGAVLHESDDIVPGLRPVTEPPKEGAKDGGLKERSL